FSRATLDVRFRRAGAVGGGHSARGRADGGVFPHRRVELLRRPASSQAGAGPRRTRCPHGGPFPQRDPCDERSTGTVGGRGIRDSCTWRGLLAATKTLAPSGRRATHFFSTPNRQRHRKSSRPEKKVDVSSTKKGQIKESRRNWGYRIFKGRLTSARMEFSQFVNSERCGDSG